MSDAPIEPQEWSFGVKVVQIEDIRAARKRNEANKPK